MLGTFSFSYGLTIGSNTAVSRQNTITFPSIDPDNRMQGFASFENGITLQNSATTCTYDCFEPLSGRVNLNGGQLRLLRDLAFSDTTRIITMGNIVGNGRVMSLAASTSSIDNTVNATYTLDTLILSLNANLTLSVHLSFNNNSTILGNGYAIDFVQTGSISAGIGGSLLLKNLTLKNVSGNRLRCLDTSATITLDNVTLIHDNHFGFTVGRLDMFNNVNLQGAYTFTYQSASVSTIQSKSALNVGYQTGFRYAPLSNQKTNIALQDATSTIFLNGGTLSSTPTGLQLTTGRLMLDGKVFVQSDATNLAEAVMFGDGISASNDLSVIMMPAAQLSITSGFVVNNNLS
jgi:hypothetical protein